MSFRHKAFFFRVFRCVCLFWPTCILISLLYEITTSHPQVKLPFDLNQLWYLARNTAHVPRPPYFTRMGHIWRLSTVFSKPALESFISCYNFLFSSCWQPPRHNMKAQLVTLYSVVYSYFKLQINIKWKFWTRWHLACSNTLCNWTSLNKSQL